MLSETTTTTTTKGNVSHKLNTYAIELYFKTSRFCTRLFSVNSHSNRALENILMVHSAPVQREQFTCCSPAAALLFLCVPQYQLALIYLLPKL